MGGSLLDSIGEAIGIVECQAQLSKLLPVEQELLFRTDLVIVDSVIDEFRVLARLIPLGHIHGHVFPPVLDVVSDHATTVFRLRSSSHP
jgi:hypothetical protein